VDNLLSVIQRLHQDTLIMDGHCDTLLKIKDDQLNIAEESKEHWDLPKAKKVNLKAQVFAAYIEENYKPGNALKRAMELINLAYNLEKQNDDFVIVHKLEDIKEICKLGKIACILSIEGGEALEEDLFLLEIFYRLGVRSIGLTWNQRNAIADGVGEGQTGGGLTRFGKKVVKLMNQLGMAVDVSHLSEASFWSVLDVSEKPIWASHSNVYQICPHVRNLNDQQIKALVKMGGVMGMNFYPAFIHQEVPSLEKLIDHIDYISNLVGSSKNICLGSDFDGIEEVIPGLEDLGMLTALTEGLLRRSYKEDDIKGILGSNMFNFFSKVW
jgi:membrane dipeptidase